MSDTELNDFEAMLAEHEREQAASPTRGPRVGDVITGQVLLIGSEAVFVDVGGKCEGVLDRAQVTDAKGQLTVTTGDVIEARVVEVDGKSGGVVLRTQIARGPDAAAELTQAFELGLPVDGVVTATNKGGFDVTIAGLRAFCPVSQIDNHFVDDPERFVGQRLTFQITKLEGGRRPNLVVSRRALLDRQAQERIGELRAKLQSGETVRGTVTQLKPFGAFVDLGGIEGMIHISELGHARVADPGDVLAIGQTVDVVVVKIEDADQPGRPARVGLSLKALQDDPWSALADQVTAGQTVTGTVVRLQPFGAFIEIRPGVEGLVHISELGAGRRINHPREVVDTGAAVEVTVLSIDPAQRRLSLSMAAANRASAEAEERANIRDSAPRAPRSLGTFGDLLKNVKLD